MNHDVRATRERWFNAIECPECHSIAEVGIANTEHRVLVSTAKCPHCEHEISYPEIRAYLASEVSTEVAMTTAEYEPLALRTEAPIDNFYHSIIGPEANFAVPWSAQHVARLLHATEGFVTEAGEMMTMLKAHLNYGKPLDLVNAQEELGDVMWYLPLAINALNELMLMNGQGSQMKNMSQIMLQNIEKLKKRYPDKFTAEAAVNRDLDAERQTLEQ